MVIKAVSSTQLSVSPHGTAEHEMLQPVEDQESVVKIMVESPKEPPNIEFGVTSPQATTVVQQKTDWKPQTDQINSQALSSSSSSTTIPPDAAKSIADIQEPIDVNKPRDTTNIFYAYEDVEFDNSIQYQPSTSVIDDEIDLTEQRSTDDRLVNIESESVDRQFVVHDENSSDIQTNQLSRQNTQSSS